MSIRKKLFIMIILTILTVSGVYYHSLSKAVEFALNGPEEMMAIQMNEDKGYTRTMSDLERLSIEFSKIIYENPSDFYNVNKMYELENMIESGIVGFNIRRNNEIIWKSSLQKQDYDISDYPEFGLTTLIQPRKQNKLNSEEDIKFVKQIDFYFSSGDVGIVYIFIKRDIVSIIRTNLFFGTVFMSLFLIIIVSIVNSLFIYRSISRPLTKLVEGVKKMKNSQYDFKFDVNKKDEISEVAKSFEELRIELLESRKIRNEYEKDRKEFIDNITHDINTPITSASMNIDAILDGMIDNEEKEKRYLKNIKEKIGVISTLVDELSLISEMELNENMSEFTLVNMEIFLNDIIDEMKYEKKYDKVEIEYRNEIQSFFKEIDVQKFRRVILNIVENSIKYSDKDEIRIRIESKLMNNKAVISIEDNGPGIQNEYVDIFKRFYREDKSRNSEISGSGLGLSIVKKIIEMHEGKIYSEKATNFENGLKINIIL